MPKNLLFITADQWRGECLSSLGHLVQTPHLDALASEGVLFKNHFANAVPCGPSRASLYTGMYLQNHRSGTNGTPLDARHTNWALELRKNGYDPTLFGYTDTSNDPRMFDEGDPAFASCGSHESYEGPLPGINPVCMMGGISNPVPWANWLAEKGHEIPSSISDLYFNQRKQDNEQGAEAPAALDMPKEHHVTWFMVDQVMEYIEKNEQQFCIHLSLLRPHPPWLAPEPYNSMYPPEMLENYVRSDSVEQEAKQHPWLDWALKQPDFILPDDPEAFARMKAAYFGLMSEVDDNLGRLFSYLKEKDLWKDTLIIFTSDHGEQAGDHHLLNKMGYFDQSYHIPLIIYDPDEKANATRGSVRTEFTESVDIMPTLLDWLGINSPVQCDGNSLIPAIHTGCKPQNWRTEAHWEFDFRDISKGETHEQSLGMTHHQCTLNVIRGRRYKYVHFTNMPPLFFDLENDPEELINQANNADYFHLVLEYAQKMLSWRMNHDEQTLTHLKLTDKGIVSRDIARYWPEPVASNPPTPRSRPGWVT